MNASSRLGGRGAWFAGSWDGDAACAPVTRPSINKPRSGHGPRTRPSPRTGRLTLTPTRGGTRSPPRPRPSRGEASKGPRVLGIHWSLRIALRERLVGPIAPHPPAAQSAPIRATPYLEGAWKIVGATRRQSGAGECPHSATGRRGRGERGRAMLSVRSVEAAGCLSDSLRYLGHRRPTCLLPPCVASLDRLSSRRPTPNLGRARGASGRHAPPRLSTADDARRTPGVSRVMQMARRKAAELRSASATDRTASAERMRVTLSARRVRAACCLPSDVRD